MVSYFYTRSAYSYSKGASTFALGHDGDGRDVWSVGEHVGVVREGIPDSLIAIEHDDQPPPCVQAVDVAIHFSLLRQLVQGVCGAAVRSPPAFPPQHRGEEKPPEVPDHRPRLGARGNFGEAPTPLRKSKDYYEGRYNRGYIHTRDQNRGPSFFSHDSMVV